MSDRFIKFIPSDEAMYLLVHKPNAFRLLTIVAERARRENGNPDGLKIGECFLGDYENCGFTRKEYRTALDILIERGHLKRIETCRTRKRSNGSTSTRGTKAKIISNSVFDINPIQDNVSAVNNLLDKKRATERATETTINPTIERATEITGQNNGIKATETTINPTIERAIERATEGPPRGHEQERTRKNKKEQQPQTPSSNSEPVVVFSCLSKITDSSVTEKHKIEITRQNLHQEQVVIDAVNVIIAIGFKPQGTMLKALRAAIRDRWKPILDESEKNKALAKHLENTVSPCRFMALNLNLDIDRGGQSLAECVNYSMSHEKFCEEIEKKGKIKLETLLRRTG